MQMFTLLVFFVVPIVHYFSIEFQKSEYRLFEWVRKNLGLILLPMIYWLLRSQFWPLTREYHEITKNKINGFLIISLLFVALK